MELNLHSNSVVLNQEGVIQVRDKFRANSRISNFERIMIMSDPKGKVITNEKWYGLKIGRFKVGFSFS